MATLHMDTEVARNTRSALVNEKQQIVEDLAKMSAAIVQLQDNWMGNSASQFFQEFAQWYDVMGKMLEEMTTMGTRLEQEINQWEQVAERF